MSNRLKAFLAALAFLIVALGGMIGSQEYVLRAGYKVILKTAPVDPRDIFRGDYVILGYEISDQAVQKLSTSSRFTTGDQIYVVLNTDVIPATVLRVASIRPKSGVYLTAHIDTLFASAQPRITFPTLSQYYVPEGRGRSLERMRRDELHVEISITHDGKARIVNLLDKNLDIIDVNDL
ncbi:MAG: hypothetical protein COA69_14260 [Robiginitomaculum sp.]|nr:MAG: hypothetical protein COA69_14260 [Robiginitomaculum sp.]